VEFAADDSTRAALERQRGTDVVHFVGHAVDPDAGGPAALVTSRRTSIDEQLDVREIAAMQLRGVGVVVLAACGTATGHGRSGESSISLARAFLAAGVPTAVATLWTIEDGPAAEFFPRLHHHLVRGLSPAEALRATQIEWLHRSDVSPATWAAVQIIGS
jgi:CHAT domain-containing protein